MMVHILVCVECDPGCLLTPGDTAEMCVKGYSYETVRLRQEIRRAEAEA